MEFDDEAADNYFIDGVNSLEVTSSPVVTSDTSGTASEKYEHVEIAQWEYCEKPYDKTTPKSVKSYYTAKGNLLRFLTIINSIHLL